MEVSPLQPSPALLGCPVAETVLCGTGRRSVRRRMDQATRGGGNIDGADVHHPDSLPGSDLPAQINLELGQRFC